MPELESSEKIQSLGDYKKPQRTIKVTIDTIVMSGLIFAGILAWFEFFRILFKNIFPRNSSTRNMNEVLSSFWFTIFITVIVVISVFIMYKLVGN